MISQKELDKLFSKYGFQINKVVSELSKQLAGLSPQEIKVVLIDLTPKYKLALTKLIKEQILSAARLSANSTARSLSTLSSGPKTISPKISPINIKLLSKRIHTLTDTYIGNLSKTIEIGLKNSKNLSEIAEKLKLSGLPQPSLIKQIKKLTEETGSLSGPKGALIQKKIAKTIEKLSDPTLKASYNQIISAINKGTTDSITKATEWWTQDKIKYHAKLITRTESIRAIATSTIQTAKSSDNCIGMIFNAYPNCCESCADLNGNKYTWDELNEDLIPVHPHCRCNWKFWVKNT